MSRWAQTRGEQAWGLRASREPSLAAPPGSDPLRAAAEATGWVREDGVGAEGPRSVWCRTPDPIVGCLALRLAPGAGWRILEAGRWEAAEVPAEGWLRELERDRLRHCDQARDDAAELGALLSKLWPGA